MSALDDLGFLAQFRRVLLAELFARLVALGAFGLERQLGDAVVGDLAARADADEFYAHRCLADAGGAADLGVLDLLGPVRRELRRELASEILYRHVEEPLGELAGVVAPVETRPHGFRLALAFRHVAA